MGKLPGPPHREGSQGDPHTGKSICSCICRLAAEVGVTSSSSVVCSESCSRRQGHCMSSCKLMTPKTVAAGSKFALDRVLCSCVLH